MVFVAGLFLDVVSGGWSWFLVSGWNIGLLSWRDFLVVGFLQGGARCWVLRGRCCSAGFLRCVS